MPSTPTHIIDVLESAMDISAGEPLHDKPLHGVGPHGEQPLVPFEKPVPPTPAGPAMSAPPPVPVANTKHNPWAAISGLFGQNAHTPAKRAQDGVTENDIMKWGLLFGPSTGGAPKTPPPVRAPSTDPSTMTENDWARLFGEPTPSKRCRSSPSGSTTSAELRRVVNSVTEMQLKPPGATQF